MRLRIFGMALMLSIISASYAVNPAYIEPKGDSSQLAYVVGSVAATPSKKPSSVYVWGIDRHEVAQAQRNWSKPVAVTPGIHKVTVALKGVYQEFDIDFCAGCSFEANATYSEKSGMMIKTMTSDLWVSRLPNGEEVSDHRPGKPIHVEVSFQSF